MDPTQFEDQLKVAETQLRRLRSLYDQWFSGIERAEPRQVRDELERLLGRLKAGPPRNTALRFRLNQVSQQYQTYSTYWKRITRQIEEGTYQRDVLRARRMRDAEGMGSRAPEAGTGDAVAGSDFEPQIRIDGSLAPPGASRAPRAPGGVSPLAMPDDDAEPRPRSIVPPGAPARSRSQPPPPGPGARPSLGAGPQGLPEAQIRALYDKFVQAREKNAERVDNVKLETLAKNVNDMLPKLREKYPGKKIGFAVVVQDGKVGLKPVAK